jgi:flagellar biosynthesis chaperone FliJ
LISSDVSALISQKKAIQRSYDEYTDFVAKLKQGFSSERLQNMQDLVKTLLADLKNTK